MVNIKKLLHQSELSLLSLLIVSLPSFEAPKNIFLVLFVVTSLGKQIIEKDLHSWKLWDWIFLTFTSTALVTTLFPAMHAAEWRGFSVLLSSISVGWLISRSKFTTTELGWLFTLAIFSTLPPLIVGLIKYLYLHNKPDLQLHSVGHVNHSAIYLTIILGASLGLLIALWKKTSFIKKSMLVSVNILFFVSLIVGQSRAAIGIGSLLTVFLFLALAQDKKLKVTGITSLVIISLTSIFLNVEVVQKQHRNEKENDILGSRDKVWNISYEAARWSPLLGIGISNWGEITPEEIKKSVEARGLNYNKDNYFFRAHSHSLYLTTLAERGLIGFSALLFLMLGWFYYLIKNFNNALKNCQGAYLWAGSFSAWAVTFGIGFVNTTFHHEHAILACILLGLFVSYINFKKYL